MRSTARFSTHCSSHHHLLLTATHTHIDTVTLSHGHSTRLDLDHAGLSRCAVCGARNGAFELWHRRDGFHPRPVVGLRYVSSHTLRATSADDTHTLILPPPGPSRAGQTRDVLEFFAVGKHLGAIFGKLESEFGVGSATHSRIAVFDLTATRPPLEKRAPPPPANSMQSLWRRLGVTCLDKKFAVSESMTVDEMHAFIDEGSHLTFDYLAMVVVAAMIAGVGLLQDSSVTVVASMLVSPLMGPILCAAFGIAVCRWDMVWRGVRNELYGVRSIHTRFLHTKLLELHESLALTSICHFMH